MAAIDASACRQALYQLMVAHLGTDGMVGNTFRVDFTGVTKKFSQHIFFLSPKHMPFSRTRIWEQVKNKIFFEGCFPHNIFLDALLTKLLLFLGLVWWFFINFKTAFCWPNLALAGHLRCVESQFFFASPLRCQCRCSPRVPLPVSRTPSLGTPLNKIPKD